MSPQGVRSSLKAVLTGSSDLENINHVVDGSRCVVVEEANSEKFKNCVDNYLNDGCKISSSSCNSRTWKAILVKEDKEQEDELI